MGSQSGAVEEIFGIYTPDNPRPFYIEIGCWDGELISQSKFLEEKGWKGICIDPFPRNFEKRNCILIDKAIDGLHTGKKPFIKVSIDRRYGGDVSYFSGFKETIQNGKAYNNDTIWNLIQTHCDYEEIEVNTISVRDFFNTYNIPHHVEFLSVDTEGSEYNILKEINYEEYSFDFIMAEHNNSTESKYGIKNLLESKGYTLCKGTHIDDIYINNTLIEEYERQKI